MLKVFSVLAGGAIGSLGRYLVGIYILKLYSGKFPLGTLLVNLIGSLIIGFLWGITESYELHPAWRTFLMIGILGGFTTFSSFSVESLNLIKSGELQTAAIYILTTNILGLVSVFSGFYLHRLIR